MCTSHFFYINAFYTREQSNPENHGNYLCSNSRWCIKSLEEHAVSTVSGSSGVLVLQGKTTEFPKTVLFLGVIAVELLFLFLSVENFELGKLHRKDEIIERSPCWSNHDETINLNNSFLSQSCEVSWGCSMKKEMTFGGRGFLKI